MRNLGEAAPNSSQRAGLVEANSTAISHNREEGRDSIQHLQRQPVRRKEKVQCEIRMEWSVSTVLQLETHLDELEALLGCLCCCWGSSGGRASDGRGDGLGDGSREGVHVMFDEVQLMFWCLSAIRYLTESRFEL